MSESDSYVEFTPRNDGILLKTLSYIIVYLRNTENATMKEPLLLIIAEYRNS